MRAIILGLAAIALVFVVGAPAMAVEEPKHQTLVADGAFEIRQYPAMIAAEVDVTGDRGDAANAGFRKLANYIFGGNAPKAKIAMTAPVVQSPRGGEKIAMTAPVVQTPTGGEDAWTVRFIMPAQYAREDLPAPNDASVRITPLPSERLAVVKFSGFATKAALDRRKSELEGWIARRGEAAAGPARYAFYDPPWTLPFIRRNEVMIPLAAPA